MDHIFMQILTKFTFVVKSREMHIGGINTVKVDTDPWLRECLDAGFSNPKKLVFVDGDRMEI